MLRVLALILIVMGSVAFAQMTEPPETPKATNGYVKMAMDVFYVELNNNPAAQACIINYGTDREIARREKQIRNSIAFRKYDASRITLVRGGYREIVKTDLWLVPPGAEPPTP